MTTELRDSKTNRKDITRNFFHWICTLCLFLLSLLFVLYTWPSGKAYAGQGTIKISISPSPDLAVFAKFSEPSGNQKLDANETGKLVITVRNTGFVTAENVRATISMNRNIKGLSLDRAVNFGDLKKGDNITREVDLKATDNLKNEAVKLTIKIRDAQRKTSDSTSVSFRTVASRKPAKPTNLSLPKLAIADTGIADQSCNLKIESKESIDVTVRIQNIGEGTAEKVQVHIIPGNHVKIGKKSKTMFDVGNLKPGSYKDVKFTFFTDSSLDNGDRIPIEVKVTERRAQFTVSEDLGFSVNGRVKSDRFMKSL